MFICPSRSEVFLFFTVRLMFDPTTKPQQMTNKSPHERTLRTNGWRVYVNLDDAFEAVAKQMQTCQTHKNIGKTIEIGPGEEGNTTLILVIYITMFNLQYWI